MIRKISVTNGTDSKTIKRTELIKKSPNEFLINIKQIKKSNVL